MQSITIGSVKTDIYNNRSIQGLSATFNLIHATINTAFTGNPVDLLQINVSVILYRNKANATIYSGNLRDLIAGTNFLKNGFKAFSSDITTFGKIALAAGAAAFEQLIVPFVIPFDCTINLKADDRIEFQMNFTTGSGGSVVGATSSVVIDAIDSVGLEWGTPIFQSSILQASVAAWNENPSNGVNRIVFLNYDKKSYLTANNVLAAANLQSDKWSMSMSTNQLIGYNQTKQGYVTTNFEPFQSIEIYSGMALQNCNLTLNLTGANVTANNNAIFTRVWNTSAWLYNRSKKLLNKHEEINMGQFN